MRLAPLMWKITITACIVKREQGRNVRRTFLLVGNIFSPGIFTLVLRQVFTSVPLLSGLLLTVSNISILVFLFLL